MATNAKGKKIKRYKAGPELARMVQELNKKYPDNDLYSLLNDLLNLPQSEQHNIWFAADATKILATKVKKFKPGAELALTKDGK